MTVLLWWGHSWMALLPHPPVHILSSIDSVLQYFDGQLHDHLVGLHTSPGALGWKLLSTLFSHILSADNWAALMDYVFLHFQDAKLVILVPVALLRSCRSLLLHSGTLSYDYIHSIYKNLRIVSKC